LGQSHGLFTTLTAAPEAKTSPHFAGVGCGVLAVFLFSLTMPMMRLAEMAFPPLLVGVGRFALAGVLGAIGLCFLGWPRLSVTQGLRVLFIGACLAYGFSALLAKALEHVPSYHAAIVTGGIPIFMALMVGWRGGRRQPVSFWLAALAGGALVAGYGLAKAGWKVTADDVMLVIAAAACGAGYGEGAKLGAEIGQARLACLVPMGVAPVAILVAWWHWPPDWRAIPAAGWLGLVYNGSISTFGAFFYWYRALHRGGAARIGQLQLLQPFFTLIVCVVILRESVRASDWGIAVLVIGCVFAAQKAGRGRTV
jgi:drug/metabolite transporter (DMT)-like permease